MPNTRKRLYGPAQIATGPTTVYTVPALTKAILRHIHVSNPSGSPVTFTMSIGADAAATREFDAYSIAANSVFDHFCFYVVDAAEIVTLSAGTNNVLVIVIDGEENTLG